MRASPFLFLLALGGCHHVFGADEPRSTRTPSVPVDYLLVELGSGTYREQSDPGRTVFDNLTYCVAAAS